MQCRRTSLAGILLHTVCMAAWQQLPQTPVGMLQQETGVPARSLCASRKLLQVLFLIRGLMFAASGLRARSAQPGHSLSSQRPSRVRGRAENGWHCHTGLVCWLLILAVLGIRTWQGTSSDCIRIACTHPGVGTEPGSGGAYRA